MNSSIQGDDNRIKIDGYNLIRSDHPSDSKKGGVCIYYKEHIPLVKLDDICTLGNCIYHSPTQNHDDFQNFCSKFDTLLDNINDEFPICSFVTGDFNARNSRWWKNDITNSAGLELDSLASSAGYTQIIDKPTHVMH